VNKKYFALKLNPSRPDFAQTMTDEEKSIMQQNDFIAGNPANKINSYEYFPMLAVLPEK
jgi:hypothetical protein